MFVAGGSLSDAIVSKEEQGELFTEDELKDLLVQVSLGLKYIHSSGLVHLDIKPSKPHWAVLGLHFLFCTVLTKKVCCLLFPLFKVIYSFASVPAQVHQVKGRVRRKITKTLQRESSTKLVFYLKLDNIFFNYVFFFFYCQAFLFLQGIWVMWTQPTVLTLRKGTAAFWPVRSFKR